MNRFTQKPYGRVISSAPLPQQSAFNASMAAQAARVPKLAGLRVGGVGIAAPARAGFTPPRGGRR